MSINNWWGSRGFYIDQPSRMSKQDLLDRIQFLKELFDTAANELIKKSEEVEGPYKDPIFSLSLENGEVTISCLRQLNMSKEEISEQKVTSFLAEIDQNERKILSEKLVDIMKTELTFEIRKEYEAKYKKAIESVMI